MTRIFGYIPCGGTGYKLRLFSIKGRKSVGTPKPSSTVLNKPVVTRIIENFSQAGIKDIFINVSLEQFSALKGMLGYGARWGVNIEWLIEEERLGAASPILSVIENPRGKNIRGRDLVVIQYGDILSDMPLEFLIQNHLKNEQALATITVNPVPLEVMYKYGSVSLEEIKNLKNDFALPRIHAFWENVLREGKKDIDIPESLTKEILGEYRDYINGVIDRQNGNKCLRVEGFNEKEKNILNLFTNLNDSSIYCFSGDLFYRLLDEGLLGAEADVFKSKTISFEYEIFPALLNHPELRNTFFGYIMPREYYWRDIGEYSDLWMANMDALDGHIDMGLPQPTRYIAEEEKFRGVKFVPPVFVDKDVEIGPGSVIGPYAVISPGWKIGSGSKIVASVLFRPYMQEDKLGREIEEGGIIKFSLAVCGKFRNLYNNLGFIEMVPKRAGFYVGTVDIAEDERIIREMEEKIEKGQSITLDENGQRVFVRSRFKY